MTRRVFANISVNASDLLQAPNYQGTAITYWTMRVKLVVCDNEPADAVTVMVYEPGGVPLWGGGEEEPPPPQPETLSAKMRRKPKNTIENDKRGPRRIVTIKNKIRMNNRMIARAENGWRDGLQYR